MTMNPQRNWHPPNTAPPKRPSVTHGPATHHRRSGIPLLALCILLCAGSVHAIIFPPGSGPDWLDFWTFNNTNTWVTARGYQPATFTNIATCDLGHSWTAILDDTNEPAWLNYNITEADGTNHFRVDHGSLMFWFAPNWCGTNEGGTGPGEWSRLIEVGAYTTNASYGWFSLYTDPDGVNLYFSAQTNDGSGITYLSAPIDWNITNRWHLITLTYSSTNSALWIDATRITNGVPMTYWPGPDVLTNGFCIGSDSSGLSQAHGMFDDLATYDHEISGKAITNAYSGQGLWYFANPNNSANISSARSAPTLAPNFNAVTGSGNLITNGAATNCANNSSVWFTNVSATLTNGAVNLKFTIAGGSNGIPYDVFANSVLDFTATANHPWAWMGQGYQCVNYSLIFSSNSAVFLILGKPQDSDSDGLTDAYERLVSKTNPLLWDTDGDGKGDGWEVLIGTNPLSYDNASSLEMPAVGSSYLRILAPDLLEMVRITSDTSDWNFVTNSILTTPSTNQFQVKSGTNSVNVTQVGYKRRALYAAFRQYDLRIENSLFLRLASTNWAASNATVEVTTTNTTLWPATNRFVSVNNPFRYSPAIHVNQAGYSPTYQKKAMIGYYLGSLNEMQISTNLGFKIVDAVTGSERTSGTLTTRPDDHNTWPSPGGVNEPLYQSVLEADFSGFTNSGQFQLVVPGLGASYPFRIDQGTMMDLARTYALGLYHQRCGSGPGSLLVNDSQFTRFPHTNCHTAKAFIPMPATNTMFTNTWGILAGYGAGAYTNNPDNPPQIAPALVDTNSMRFKFPTAVTNVDVAGGYHDAGDYSKYTTSAALLLHTLTFAADNLGLTNFDNFGIPESTNRIPDILEAAKWQADFLVKMQDTNDGGFYFLVYPIDEEYENTEQPGPHTQVVWPKTTAATASAVAALAEIGSSPIFNSITNFRSAATNYLKAATNGWKFLTNAIATYGKDGCYQRITHYGDRFTHDDELAWAASALFAATGNTNYRAKLLKWYPNPADINAHNGYSFKRYDSTNNFPANSNLFVAVAYVPNTSNVLSASNKMWFTIFDSEGQKVMTNRSETAIPLGNTIEDTRVITNKLYDLKTSLNANPNDLYQLAALDKVATLVGFCHQTWINGWQRMSEGYGCAIRDYAFAVRSGRRGTNEMDTNYLAQCESEITNRAAQLRLWSSQNSYGTSLSRDEKGYFGSQYGVAYYFGGDRAFDLAVADRVHPDTNNAAAIIENLNYEVGRNPLNVSFLTGLGWVRQRQIVDQYSWNNPASVLPRSGIPIANISDRLEPPGGFPYGNLQNYSFPGYGGVGTNSFPLYDRWADSYNVIIEFVHLQMANSLAAAGALASLSPLTNQVWQRASATIVFPNGLPAYSTKCTAQLSTTQDLSGAQILWDPGSAPWNFLGQNPAYGTNYTFIPGSVGDGRTLQAEAVLPDGRRVFATNIFSVWDPVHGGTNFVNDASTIALYHFDDKNNPCADSSGHGYTLTVHTNTPNGVVLANNPNWMASPAGFAARFKSVGNYLEVTNISPTAIFPNPSASLTIDLRIYPRAYNGTENIYMLELFQNPTNSYDCNWSIFHGDFIPQIYASQAFVLLSSSLWQQTITPNTWHQVRVTVGPIVSGQNETIVYVDGLAWTTNYPPAPNNNSIQNWILHIGDFDGDLDEVRISSTLRQ